MSNVAWTFPITQTSPLVGQVANDRMEIQAMATGDDLRSISVGVVRQHRGRRAMLCTHLDLQGNTNQLCAKTAGCKVYCITACTQPDDTGRNGCWWHHHGEMRTHQLVRQPLGVSQGGLDVIPSLVQGGGHIPNSAGTSAVSQCRSMNTQQLAHAGLYLSLKQGCSSHASMRPGQASSPIPCCTAHGRRSKVWTYRIKEIVDDLGGVCHPDPEVHLKLL